MSAVRRLLPARRELFHPGRQVRGLADRGVVHVEIAADGPDHDRARVQPDANLERDAVGAANLLGIPAHGGLHVERGIARPHGMVLVGDRRPEQGHDAVAHHLVDRALVAVDRLHHPFEHRIEKLARFLGVTVGEQLHRALQVGEQHRDLLALAFERAPGGQDLLGEVPGGVGLRGVESLSRRRRGRWPGGVRTLGAEPRGRRQGPTALGARPGQRRGTFLAELRACLVLALAPGAFHRPDLPHAVRSVYCRVKSGPSVPGGSQRVKDRRAGAGWCAGRLLTRSDPGWIDPHFRGAHRRPGEPAGEPFRMRRVGGGQHGGPGRHSVLGQAGVHVMRREQAEAAMMMFDVVPEEEAVAVGAGVLDRAEPRREVRPVLQRLELGLGERVVVGHVRPAVGLRDRPGRPAGTRRPSRSSPRRGRRGSSARSRAMLCWVQVSWMNCSASVALSRWATIQPTT